MKQILLPVLLAAATLGMSAIEPDADAIAAGAAQSVKVSKVKKQTHAAAARKAAKGISIDCGRIKRLDNRLGNNIVMPLARQKTIAKAAPDGAVLYESFEGWDGASLDWLPDGWTRQQKAELNESWTISDASSMAMLGLTPSDGDYAFGINYGMDQDEWLISPAVDVPEGMVFTFMAYIDPTFLFSLDNVDWDNMQFIGEPVVAATLQVMAKSEGDDEWTMLHDFVDDYKGMNLDELLTKSPA